MGAPLSYIPEVHVSKVDSSTQEEFFQSFLVTLLWSTNHGEDGNLDDDHDLQDIHPDTITGLRKECDQFLEENHDDIQALISEVEGYTFATAGHDLVLSRNGHGAGFFDMGLDVADRLQAAADKMSQVDAYLGDDGMVYVMGMEPPRPATSGPKP